MIKCPKCKFHGVKLLLDSQIDPVNDHFKCYKCDYTWVRPKKAFIAARKQEYAEKKSKSVLGVKD